MTEHIDGVQVVGRSRKIREENSKANFALKFTIDVRFCPVHGHLSIGVKFIRDFPILISTCAVRRHRSASVQNRKPQYSLVAGLSLPASTFPRY